MMATAVGRTTATRLVLGSKILVEPLSAPTANGETVRSTTKKLTGKNGVVVATVTGIEAYRSGYTSMRTTTYRRITTDQGVVIAAPSQTFAVAPTT